MRFRSIPWIVILAGIPAMGDEGFEKHVRPLLIDRCFKCHSSAKVSGGLRLDSREAILKGGDSGPAAISGKPAESLMIAAIEHRGELRMPKEKLPEADITRVKEWVSRGLPFPAASGGTSGVAASHNMTDEHRRWWAYQPVRVTAAPSVRDTSWANNEIDRFILAKLDAQSLSPSRLADKRTLLRRITYDLTGLPPTPQEADAFINDQSPNAFANTVERLLASPAYGERWGRHWLDLVRYADTAGENSDHPAPHAWRYRNWVIDAFNRDQPYDEFVREQLAGDLLATKGPPELYSSRVVATGFLAIARRFGHDTDKDMHLTFEDTIDTIGRAFLGQSIACARCHDHKYDPFTSSDYYALYGILQSTRFPFPGCEFKQPSRDLVPLMPPAEWARSVEPHQKKLAGLEAELKRAVDAMSTRSKTTGTLVAKARKTIAKGEIKDGGQQSIESSTGRPLDPIDVKPGQTIQLSILPLSNHGADSTLVEWQIEELDGKKRRWDLTKDVIDDFLAGNPHGDKYGNARVWWFLDGREHLKLLPEKLRDSSGKTGLNVWRNGDTPSILVNASDKPIAAWTTLPARSLFVHPAPNGPVALAWVSPIEGKVRITGRVADAHPGGPDGVGWVLEHLAIDLTAEAKELAFLGAAHAKLMAQRAEMLANAPRADMAYAVTDGKTENARIHLRGDPEKLGPEVPRRWLTLLGGKPVPTGTGSGRLQLAEWLIDPANGLTARVMVNRIWQHHFGKGLVPTPNDFGTRGQPPTHPELLDRLAAQFVEDGWSIKKMHRRIVLSATYQQAGQARAEAIQRDANNTLNWRFDRRRLSAEELRDSILVSGGKLDRVPGGPHPFPAESTWNFSQHVPFSTFYDSDKRSVYLVTLRNRRHPFLGLFDGADPNASTAVRQTTTVPTQALYFMNDPFVHRQADWLTDRLLLVPDNTARLEELFRILFQRLPVETDRVKAEAFRNRYVATLAENPATAEKAGWAALVRVLISSNEFLHVE